MRILVVDDHELVRGGILSLLATEPAFSVCGEAADGRDAVEKAKALRPDIVIMDVNLPNMSGLEATREIKRLNPETEIVIVSLHQAPEVVRQALDAGARGYMVKSAMSTELLAAIAKVARQETFINAAGYRESNEDFDPAEISQRDSSFERPHRDSEAGGINNLLDVTERKQAERAAALLNAIVDFSDDAIVSKDLDGFITSWNKSAERLFGYTAEEAIGQHITLIIPRNRRTEEAMILERIRRGERVEHFDTVRQRKDGTSIDISLTISPVKDLSGHVIGASKVARDISERKQAERENRLLAAIVDCSDDAIISKSLDGVITSWNKSAERMFGFAAEEAIGQHMTLIIPKDRVHEETNILERLRRGERIEHFETVRVRKDGTTLDISLTVSPVRDLAGRITGASKVARDITEQKRNEKALRESENRLRALTNTLETQVRIRTEQLEQRNREVVKQSELLRELTHHLMQVQDEERRHIARELHDSAGQTLAVLGLNLAAVAQQVRTKDSQLSRMVEEGQRLVKELSQEIRTTSYLLHPPLLDESGLSGALLWYVQGLKDRSDLDINLTIRRDFGRLAQEMELAIFRIVQECLTNICRHSRSKVAAIRVLRDDENVFLEVQDEGRGISAAKLAEIQSRGAGVGIRGMRERALQFGGQIKIQSEGRGTTILITLPLVKPAGSEMTKPVQMAQRAG
jgi:PAS domain S-box-containing protein